MGSKMPNCLRTAMKRMMTTPMANSSMPWIPITSGQGRGVGGGGPTQGRACTRRPGFGERDDRKPGAGLVNDKAFQQGWTRTGQDSVWLVGGSMGLFPGPGRSMRTRPVSWMKAALMSTPMLKWKKRGSRHIWKTSLSGPMRENGGCVTSHLLQCIKGDVKSHFPDFHPAYTHSGARTGKDTSYCSSS